MIAQPRGFQMTIEKIKRKEYRAVLNAVYDSFNTFDAADYTERGCASFMGYASFNNFVYRQRNNHETFVAKVEDDIAGMIETRNRNHISMLFVPPKHIKTGIGRALMEYAIAHMRETNANLHRITVNASPYAYGFYRHMGFLDAEPTVETDGMIYTPMKLLVSPFAEILSNTKENALL